MEAETKIIEENPVDLKIGSNYLGKKHHPAIGIRIPEIFLTGIVNSLQKHKCAAGLMLSFGRETAPDEIINAPPGRYEITLGHTGTSIRKYLVAGSRAARSAAIPVEMEADHLIITESSAIAVKRIEGIKTPKLIGNAALEKAIKYNVQAVEEAVSTGLVRAYTTDASDLFDEDVTKFKMTALRKRLNEYFTEEEREYISKNLVGKHRLRGADNKVVRLEINKERAIKLALKYRHSVNINARLFEEISSRMKHPFAWEISLDETEKPTPPADLFIFLGLWKMKGLPCDYVAPNVGFQKREDFTGDMEMFRNRVRALNAVADLYGSMLSFHSGSGATPYSGKGQGVYETILEATGGKLKYKISGVYYELLIELLAGHKKGTDARILYELIHKEVMDFLRKQIETKGPLHSELLKKQISTYDQAKQEFDPRAECFRYNSFLALNFRDQKGRRYYRERLIRLYLDDLKLKKQVDQEVEALTSRLIEGLKFANNY